MPEARTDEMSKPGEDYGEWRERVLVPAFRERKTPPERERRDGGGQPGCPFYPDRLNEKSRGPK